MTNSAINHYLKNSTTLQDQKTILFATKKLQFITTCFALKRELLNTLANYNSRLKINKNG